MSYQAIYRKYRPASFDEVKGQDHIVTTLINQINYDRIGHAYLFCGTRGTGKTSVAKLFAKAVNCESPVNGNPCGSCSVCRSIAAGTSMNVIEIDAASNNGVDSIRDIIDEVKYSPTEGKYKVYIIDEVHMLSPGAFNALLKTLEEPPSYVIFILATTEVHKLPITILSRCQRYDFKRITVDTLTARLREIVDNEHIEADDRALRYIAKTGDGSMRDSQSLLDQCIAFTLGKPLSYESVLEVLGTVDIEVFAELLRYIIKGSVDEVMKIIDRLIMQGREMTRFVSDFAWYLRNLLIAKTADNPDSVLEFSAERMEMLLHESQVIPEELIIRYIRVLSELSNSIRYATQKRLLVEVAMIKLCKPEMESDYGSLINRIANLEKRLEDGSFVKAVQPAADQVTGDAPTQEAAALSMKSAEELLEAVPEDIRDVAANWDKIVAGQSAVMKPILVGAKPSLTDNGKLLIVCASTVDKDCLLSGNRLELIHDTIAKLTGKDVNIVLAAAGEDTGTEKAPDISKLINMKIEYID